MYNVDYDVSYEFMLNDYEGQAQICPEGSKLELLIVAFLQICISKAVLWPPVLICVRSLFSD